MSRITSFSGDYSFLSNFYSSRIEYQGIVYPTLEHAYQAAKTSSLGQKVIISRLPTPGKAKRYGQKITLVPEWQSRKVEVMEELLRIKFQEGSALAHMLMETEGHELIEGNYHRDQFWGCTTHNSVFWTGSNWLGILLMKIRGELLTFSK